MVYPLQTLSNLLAALREEDYSLRARGARPDDALGEVMVEVNALGEMLRGRRLGALEATALLRKVMEEIDVAVFTFDSEQRLRLMNRAGERLLGQPSERILGRTAAELGLADCLEGEPARTLTISFPGGAGRWAMRRSAFRENGMPHELLVLTDLSRPLREEERQAWQRLIRVLGHELNNSLAPIKSMAGTLGDDAGTPAAAGGLGRRHAPRPGSDWVAGGGAEPLLGSLLAARQVCRDQSCKRWKWAPCCVVSWDWRSERRFSLSPAPTWLSAPTPTSWSSLLINLLRNAVDAALETGGGVSVGWARRADQLEVRIRDEGPGLSNTSNLFVPFFTTKPTGSGIGLVLSRQIAEAHGGSLTLENRRDRAGCEARLRLPLRGSHSSPEAGLSDANGS